MRAAAYVTAAQLDLGHYGTDENQREEASIRMALLTPIVKGWLTEVAQEVTSLGVQVHGGMGFVEESGAAQYMRDARILPIYEGTTGIQANDLVGRKVLGDDGRAMRSLIADMHATAELLGQSDSLENLQQPLHAAIEGLEAAVSWLIDNAPDDPNLPGAAAVNLLMQAGTVLGGWQMARSALAVSAAASRADANFRDAKLHTARFYIKNILPRSEAYRHAATAGSESVMAIPEALF